ncbi:putative reverse transcriptase domain-containing protein [Tanacetum coccineum]
MTQAAIRRMIKESVDAAIVAERARQANVRNDASGSGPGRGRDTAPTVCECTFARWFEKTESVFEISKCEEGKKVKFAAATLLGPALTWWRTKVATIGLETVNQMTWTEMKKLMTVEFCSIEEVQRMEHELWKLKVKEYDVVAYTQRFNELALMCPRMVESERVKVDAYIRGLTNNIKGEVTSSKPADLNEAVRMAHEFWKERSESGRTFKVEIVVERAIKGITLVMLYRCTIKCHKRGKVRHKARYCKEKSVATGANAQSVWTCYDCGEQGHTRNRCSKRIKQEEVGEVRSQAYAIKDAEPQGPNVVIGMFLLNNQYASVLFDSGSDRSFVNTRFSSLLDIKPIKIEDSYEVELADGRIVSTNTILNGCTLSLVNHVFVIDLMPIELVVRIPYGNKMLIVEGDKGVSRLKVISCIKARKYVERGCHLFLAHVTENKSKERRMEDVPVIHDFPEVFPEELPELSVATPVARAPYRLAPSEMKKLSVQLQELL